MISVCKSLSTPRQVGIKITLDKPVSDANTADIQLLKRALEVHGAVCLPGSNLTPLQLKEFSAKWGEVLLLPPGLAFNAQIASVPEVARVGNVAADGSVMKKHTAAEYWHHDGDFWGTGENHILNFLYCVKTPEVGGNTGFLDTRKAFLDLSEEEKKKLLNAYIVVHGSDIEDFKHLPAEAQPADVKHAVLLKHPHTGQQSLYLPESSTGIQDADGNLIGQTKDYVSKIEKNYKIEYKWTEGDLLIWDNITTMHRSMGGYFDSPRLLLRCQARLRAPILSFGLRYPLCAPKLSAVASVCSRKFLFYSSTLRGSKARALFPYRRLLRVFR